MIDSIEEHLSPFLAWLKERGLEICASAESRDTVAGRSVLGWYPVDKSWLLDEYRAHRESRRGAIPRRPV